MNRSWLLAFLILAGTDTYAADDVGAWYAQGRLLAFNGKTDAAIEVLTAALKKDPHHLEAHRQYQDARWLRNREAVLQEYATLANASPQDADLLYLHGRLLCMAQKLEDGQARFGQCLKLQPKHQPARSGLAACHSLRKEWSAAKQIIDELLKEDPENVTHWSFRQVIAGSTQDHESMRHCTDRLATIQTNDPNDQLQICLSLIAGGRTELGKARLQTMVARYPEAPTVLMAQAQFLGIEGKLAEAEAILTRAIGIEPNLVDLHRTLASVYRATGRLDLEKREIEASERLAPAGVAVNYQPGAGFVAADAGAAAHHQNLGAAYLESGELAKAEDQFRRAIERQPSLVAARMHLAQLLWQTDRKDEAFRLLEKIDTIPEDQRACVHSQRGGLLYDDGRIREAHESWKAALKAAQADGTSRRQLQRLVDATASGQPPKVKRLEKISHPPCLRRSYCLPVAVATCRGFWGMKTDPVEIGKEYVEGSKGTEHAVLFLRGQTGFECLAFRATPEAFRSCIDQGVPAILWRLLATLGDDGKGSGHASTVVGYDETRGALLTMDGSLSIENWIFYEDLPPSLACVLIPRGKKMNTSALDLEEGERLFDLVVEATRKEDDRFNSLCRGIQRGRIEKDYLTYCHLLTCGKPSTALPHLEKVVDALPSNALLQTLLGGYLVQDGKRSQGIVRLQKALEFDPSSAITHIWLANALVRTGRTDECLQHLEIVRQMGSLNPDVHYLLGYVAMEMRKTDVLERELKFLDLVSPERAQSLRAAKRDYDDPDPKAARMQERLGWRLETGQGLAKDQAQAAKWYRKAAEQNLASAQSRLGWIYFTGSGVVQDRTEAMNWWRKAAGQGDVYAQGALGYMYQSGQGVLKDDAEAVRWYRRVAEQDAVEAYKFCTLSAWLGNQQAAQELKTLAGRMTPEQIMEGTRRADTWLREKRTAP